MTQGVTFGDMFVNFGKCLQTFSILGKYPIWNPTKHHNKTPGIIMGEVGLWGCDNGNVYDLSKEPNLRNAFIKCILRVLYLSLRVLTVYLCDKSLIPIISPHPLNHRATIWAPFSPCDCLIMLILVNIFTPRVFRESWVGTRCSWRLFTLGETRGLSYKDNGSHFTPGVSWLWCHNHCPGSWHGV